MSEIKATVGVPGEYTTELTFGSNIIETNRMHQETIEGTRATLRRDVLMVIGLEPEPNGSIKVTARNAAGDIVPLQTDPAGRLRDYTSVNLYRQVPDYRP